MRFDVNVVEVCEVRTPKGKAPVRWLPVTARAIDTDENCGHIVDLDRARWQIKEYFKSLKTGSTYLNSQHRSAHTRLATLSVKAMVAWNLFVIRYLVATTKTSKAAAGSHPHNLRF
ncbi:hypothetical protein DL240_11280 [Lujinxingia litoralis]|uniref:Transposase IS4-like domain-containing protein n=1 Tax=Lujinxingia litoralis TaxID=2211119 RepID=A0A328C6I8_9DELT|nr:hypothetical protein [Lujinxingia litoralis]RAL22422.1 hypothetical protein DL240_11280 [Lujinxingia litoralis]